MTVYKNEITGEYHIAENKTRAWIYFFYEAERKGKERPEMYNISEIDINKRIIDFKGRLKNR